jgi:DNA-binding YbaB/EbfC family protein
LKRSRKMNKNILRQAQEMQAKLAKAQEELEHATLEASSGGGAVTVVVTGHQSIRSIKISPEVVDPEDVEMLEDLVMAAVNEAMDKARELAASQLQGMTGGLKIPGLM